MVPSERRTTQRFKLHTQLSFHRMELLSEGEHQARALNISTGGLYFTTDLPISVGEAIEVRLEIPKRVTGEKAKSRRFTGRVVHVESKNMPRGHSGVGVQLLYYELTKALGSAYSV
jgi:Tfp pilus assembly protein PilZ